MSDLAKGIGEGIAVAWAVVMFAVFVTGVLDLLDERRERERLADLERRAEKLTRDTELSARLIEAAMQRDLQGVYDQDADRFERQYEPTDMGRVLERGMYGFEAWEAKVAREAAAEQARHLASDEWAGELEAWVNRTP